MEETTKYRIEETTYPEGGFPYASGDVRLDLIHESLKPGDRCFLIKYQDNLWDMAASETEARQVIADKERECATSARAQQLAKTLLPPLVSLVAPLVDQLSKEFEELSRTKAEFLAAWALSGVARRELDRIDELKHKARMALPWEPRRAGGQLVEV